MTVFDDDGPGPRGPVLFFGGQFRHIGEMPVNRIARLDATGWSPLAEGVAGDIRAMAVFDDGTGPALFAGGGFTRMNGVAAAGLARWDGHAWTAVGQGFRVTPMAMTVYDDGRGAALYCAGMYGPSDADLEEEGAVGVCRWDGQAWSAVGPAIGSMVMCLAGFDDGHGPNLYAGGLQSTEAGHEFGGVAAREGTGWTGLRDGLGGDEDEFEFPQAYAITPFDDGRGRALFVLGEFVAAGGIPAARIARWDGRAWSGLGTGLDGSNMLGWGALTVYDDGAGPRLFVGGRFEPTADMPATNLACWGRPRR